MDLSALFNDPELMQRLSESGIFPDEMDLMSQQMQRAQALRKTPGAQGREVGPYNVYTAASPLEHLAVGLERYQGGRDTKNTSQQQKDLLDRSRFGIIEQAKALAKALQGNGAVDQGSLSVPEMY